MTSCGSSMFCSTKTENATQEMHYVTYELICSNYVFCFSIFLFSFCFPCFCSLKSNSYYNSYMVQLQSYGYLTLDKSTYFPLLAILLASFYVWIPISLISKVSYCQIRDLRLNLCLHQKPIKYLNLMIKNNHQE